MVPASYADADDVHNINKGAAVRRLLVLVRLRLRHLRAERLADRAADRRAVAEPDVVDAFVRADDCADLFGADRRADDVTFACPDARFRRAFLLLYLRHDSPDAVADGRAVAVTDAGAVGSAVGRRSGDKAARTDTYLLVYNYSILAPPAIALAHGAHERPEHRGRCLLYTSPSPRDQRGSRMPSSA